jgi:acyl-CoA synthetase (AMP-forming)/AMP-acid ligase II
MNIQNKPTFSPSTQNSLVNILQKRAIEFPEKIAFISILDGQGDVKKISYAELDRKAKEIAATLQSFTSPQEKALLIFPPGLEYITALFGCLYAGVIAVPVCPPDLDHLDRDLPALKNIISDAQANVILTNSSYFSLSGYFYLLASDYGTIQWLTTEKVALASEYDFHPLPIQNNPIAILEYTPGVSKILRGVNLTHENIIRSLSSYETIFGFHESTTNLSWLPPYYDMGLVEGILQSIYSGCQTIHLPSHLIQKDPLLWMRTISKYQVNISGGPDCVYDSCVDQILRGETVDLMLEKWTTAFIGAKKLHGVTLDRFIEVFYKFGFTKEAFIPYYGIIGTSLFISGGRFSEKSGACRISNIPLKNNIFKFGNGQIKDEIIGYKVDQNQHPVYIVNTISQQLLNSLEVGEVVIPSYPNQNRMKFPFDEIKSQVTILDFDQGGFFKTGDLGFLDQGYLYVLGKIENHISYQNCWYFPQDIERILANSVLELNQGNCSVIGISNNDTEELVILFEVNDQLANQPTDQKQIQAQKIINIIQNLINDHCGSMKATILLLKPNSLPTIACGIRKSDLVKEYYLSGFFNQRVIT